MPAPRFVHLRLHTEYSIVDGTARVDAAVAAAAADGMPALAVTDAGNLFGALKFYLAARARGVQPVIGCDLAITNEKSRDQPFRVVALCRDGAGYLALCDLITRAYATNQWRGRAEVRREWLCGARGLIVLSGAEGGDVGAALLAGATRRPRSSPAAGRATSRAPSTWSCSAPTRRGTRPTCARRWRSRAGSSFRWWPRTRCSSCGPRNTPRTRRACASRRAGSSPTRAGRATSARRNTSRPRPRWPSSSPTSRRRSRTRSRSRAAAPSSSRWARPGCRTSRRRRG